GISDPAQRLQVLAALALASVPLCDRDEVRRWVTAIEQHARTLPHDPAETVTRLAEALTAAGEHDRAAALIGTLDNPVVQVCLLAELATAIAKAGDRDRAQALAADGERLASGISQP